MTFRTLPLFLSLLLLGTAGCSRSGRLPAAPDRPNIILFLADDAGWNDVGYHGSEIRTPHLDRMAREGVELDQFYAYPTCSPTRAALLAGRPPSRYGILGPIGGTSTLALPPDTLTLADLLGAQGYHTAITGKWHLGLRPEVGPAQYGFAYTYGYLHGQIDPYTHRYKYGDVTWHRQGSFVKEAGHATDLIAREAVRFIREERDPERPFFLYVPFSVPHYPLQEPEAYVEPYRASIDHEWRRQQAASMTHMDDAIGQVLAALREEGLEGRTLVIFASDNGGQESWTPTPREYDGRYAPHDRLGDNKPLRGWKTEVYEGGIRVPAVLYWPGRLAPRKVTEPAVVYDLLPTLALLAGAAVPEGAEGINLWPAVAEGGALPERALYWREHDSSALRLGVWKLIRHGRTPAEARYELYNLAEDPSETRDLAAQHPDRLAPLRAALEAELARDDLDGYHLTEN